MTLNAATEAARLSVAPMMDWTDRHCRMFHRQFSRHVQLYTEMITAAALVRGGAEYLLDHAPAEHPLVLQLGGSDPQQLALAAKMATPLGFAEINLNVGCPSDRVQSGCFGAALMKDPALVAQCCATMLAETDLPVTVKCRIGVDDQTPAEVLPAFIETVAQAGVTRFVIHARMAWLSGLSPKENREVPPLDYDLVFEMKRQFSDLWIGINGGVTELSEAEALLARGVDGVMIGRAAYHRPTDILGTADRRFFGSGVDVSAEEAVTAMLPYIEAQMRQDVRLNQITRHMLGAFTGRPGARRWRRILSEGAHLPGAGPDLVLKAMAEVSDLAA